MPIVGERLGNVLVFDTIVVFPLEAFPYKTNVFGAWDPYNFTSFLVPFLDFVSFGSKRHRATYRQQATFAVESFDVAVGMNLGCIRVEASYEFPLLRRREILLSLYHDDLMGPNCIC